MLFSISVFCMVAGSRMRARNIVKLIRLWGAITVFCNVCGVEIHFFDRTLMNSELKMEVTRSRSTLALALRELQEERLIEREVVDTRPVQTRYSLTGLGAEVAGHLSEIKRLISS